MGELRIKLFDAERRAKIAEKAQAFRAAEKKAARLRTDAEIEAQDLLNVAQLELRACGDEGIDDLLALDEQISRDRKHKENPFGHALYFRDGLAAGVKWEQPKVPGKQDAPKKLETPEEERTRLELEAKAADATARAARSKAKGLGAANGGGK